MSKLKVDGTVERFKTHLVVRGDHQLDGFDFREASALVVKMAGVRVFLSVAVAKGRRLHQMDVNSAFLPRDLLEKVYMHLSLRYTASSPNKV